MKAYQLPLPIRDRRQRHWHWSPDIVLDAYGSILGPHGLAAYYALCRYADEEQVAFPKVITIAGVTGMSTRQVIRAIRLLKKYGLISVVQRAGMTSQYLLLDPPEIPSPVRRAMSETPATQSPTPDHQSVLTTSHPELNDIDDVLISQQQYHLVLEGGMGGDDGQLPGIKEHAEEIIQILERHGVTAAMAQGLASTIPGPVIRAWCHWVSLRANLDLGPGFLVQQIRTGRYPPP